MLRTLKIYSQLKYTGHVSRSQSRRMGFPLGTLSTRVGGWWSRGSAKNKHHSWRLQIKNQNKTSLLKELLQQGLIQNTSCLNFWDEAWWFLSVRVFRLLSSTLLGFFPSISAAVSSGLPQVSPVYLGIEMIQPEKFIFTVWLLIKQGVQQSNFKNDFPGWIISMPR